MITEPNRNDPLTQHIGKLVIVKLANESFVSKLVAVVGQELWLEAKNGHQVMVNRCNVLSLRPLEGGF